MAETVSCLQAYMKYLRASGHPRNGASQSEVLRGCRSQDSHPLWQGIPGERCGKDHEQSWVGLIPGHKSFDSQLH